MKQKRCFLGMLKLETRVFFHSVQVMNFMESDNFFYWHACLAELELKFYVIAFASEMASTGLSGMLSPSIGNLSHLRTL